MKKLLLFALSFALGISLQGQSGGGGTVINLDPSSTGTINALLQANMNMIWVSIDNTTGVETGSFIYPYNTMQEGIDAAAIGDVVIVLAPSDNTTLYEEHLVMSTDSVRLMTLEGQTVKVELQSSSSTGLLITGDGVIIGGGSGMGFTFTADAGRMLEMAADEDDVEISYNKIIVDGGGTIGISIGAAGATRLKIKNNLFITASGQGAIYAVKNLTDALIIDNEFQGADSTSGYAIQISGFYNGIIDRNYVHKGQTVAGGFASGIFVHTNTSDSHVSDSINITNNTIQDCSNGIRLGHANGADMKEVYVYGNILQRNSRGIFVHNDAQVFPATYDIYNNTLSDNATNIVNDHATGLNIGLNTFEEKVIIGYTASDQLVLLSPTSTGEVDTTETADIGDVALNHSGAFIFVTTEGTQTIGTGGTFERLNEGNIAYGADDLADFTHDDGRLTYTGTVTKHFAVSVNVTIESDEVAALIQIRLAKGGTTIANSNMQANFSVQDNDDSWGFCWVLPLATNEYIEVFGTSDTNGDTFVLHNLTMCVDQH